MCVQVFCAPYGSAERTCTPVQVDLHTNLHTNLHTYSFRTLRTVEESHAQAIATSFAVACGFCLRYSRTLSDAVPAMVWL